MTTAALKVTTPSEREVMIARVGETLVTTDLVEQKGKTTLTTTVRYASREARDNALKTGMTTGMEAGYNLLDALLEEQR